MTVKLIENVTWNTFGFGMIAKSLQTDPTTQDDPFVTFTHKLAVAGRYHNGEPILTAKQEKEVQKDCDALIALLQKFNHTDDYIKVVENAKPATRKSQAKAEAKTEEPAREKRKYVRKQKPLDVSMLVEVVPTKAAKKRTTKKADAPVEEKTETKTVARRGGRRKKEQPVLEAA